MTHTYKGHKIDRNMNGKWIVTNKDNSHSQHNTLADAKEWISLLATVKEFGSEA
jgi:hypothetical protein